MKTVHKVLITVFSFTLIISILFLLLSVFINDGSSDSLGSDGGYNGAEFKTLNSASLATQYPLVESDFDNIYYCVKADGSVEFFEYNGTSFSKYSGEVNTVELKPTCTYYKIPINVYYIEKDGKTLGYGLFTTENSDADVNLYSYVFAKLIDAPTVYGMKGKMLLLSTDETTAYCKNKVYTEFFSVDMAKKACSTVVAQRDRNADKTGRKSERWAMLTDSYLATVSKRAGIISGRLYDESTEIYDFYDINKSENNPHKKGMYGTFLREDSDSGIIYLKKTSDGFNSVKYITEEKVIAEFKGDFEKGFVFSGDWVFDRENKTFTNLISGKRIEAKKASGSITDFTVNSKGNLIVALSSNQVNQAFSIIDENGDVKQYTGNSVYTAQVKNASFADDTTVLTTFVDGDGGCLNYLTKIN